MEIPFVPQERNTFLCVDLPCLFYFFRFDNDTHIPFHLSAASDCKATIKCGGIAGCEDGTYTRARRRSSNCLELQAERAALHYGEVTAILSVRRIQIITLYVTPIYQKDRHCSIIGEASCALITTQTSPLNSMCSHHNYLSSLQGYFLRLQQKQSRYRLTASLSSSRCVRPSSSGFKPRRPASSGSTTSSNYSGLSQVTPILLLVRKLEFISKCALERSAEIFIYITIYQAAANSFGSSTITHSLTPLSAPEQLALTAITSPQRIP